MKNRTRWIVSVVLATAGTMLAAQTQLGAQGTLRERLAERRAARASGGAAGDMMMDVGGRADRTGTRVAYGDDPEQRVLIWRTPSASTGKRPPLAVFIHGGGWSKGAPEMVDSKPGWFNSHGWAFASIGYRLLPGSPVEEQARDVGRALAKLRADAARFGYDPDRILLLGHSAGAHLTALVATDPQYAGASFPALRGALLIDGACYDVPMQIKASPFMAKRTYIPAFGSDPARQRELSPINHAGNRDVPDWLMLYSSARDDAEAQTRKLAAALGKSVRTEVFEVPSDQNARKGHMEINREFGTSGYAANDQIEAIMRRVAG